ncbi:MAG: glutamate racemase [Oscillospiraceae bacterium]|nr:glutamate racemase [Oscillospiraceae bacterium]
MNNSPIGVFDSGLGGLTCVKQLLQLAPQEDIVYLGDTGRVPYGTRSTDTIIKYAMQDIEFLLSRGVKILIAACGTVSSTLPHSISDALPVPYLGVVESTAAAAVKATKTGRIGVIGTPATIKSGSYLRAIDILLPSAVLVKNPCPLFVPLVESGYVQRDNPVTRMVAEEYLAPIKAAGVDTLIMGCTHYPIIKDIISDVMGPEVTLIDPGKEAAAAGMALLKKLDMEALRDCSGARNYFVSDGIENFHQNAELFLGSLAGGSVDQIAID